MKRLISAALAMLMCLLLLCGCTDMAAGSRADSADETPLFSQMEYVRPDVEGTLNDIKAVLDELEGGCSLSRTKALLEQCYADYYYFDTMDVLADIRANQDLTNDFYLEESIWCDENFYIIQQEFERMLYACADSRIAARLEKEFFWEGFQADYSDESENVFNDSYVRLKQEESNLIAEYYALCTDPKIMLDGDEVHVNDYLELSGGYDYFRVITKYYEQYNERFADVYIRLINVRKALAKELGYSSYEQMQYDFFFARDYTPEDARGYLEEVKQYLVPLYKRMMETDPYSKVVYYIIEEGEAMEVLRCVAEEMGGDIAEAYEFMLSHELCDTELRQNKADISYETYLYNFDAPFMFVNPTGNVTDILSIAHEFGHYTDAYVNYNASETVDLSECFSQGMELLAICRLDTAMDKYDAENLQLIKLLDVLETYVQQASFAEFESIIYNADEEELTAEFINSVTLELAKEYGYYDGVSESYYSNSWPAIVHFFEQPFYVISYPVSNEIALQIYEMELENSGSGLEKYLEMLPRQSENIIETVSAAGLESPFSEGSTERIANALERLAMERLLKQ